VSRLPGTRRLAVAALAAAAFLLSACSEVEDAVGDASAAAGCQVAQRAVDGVADAARGAADRIGADPEAARRELRGLRDTLAAAAPTLSGDVRTRVDEIRAALDDLVTEATEAGRDAVDQAAVDRARDELDQAVDGLRSVC